MYEPNEEVGDGIIGNFNFGNGEGSLYYDRPSASRLNKASTEHESSFNADFLEEDLDDATTGKGFISSLISDQSRHFNNLMPDDYHSSPSNLYSSRLLSNTDGRFNQDVSTNEDQSLSGRGFTASSNSSRMPSGLSGTPSLTQHSLESSLDRTTLSMQQLYVSEDESHRGGRVQSPEIMNGHLSSNSLTQSSTSPSGSTSITGIRRTPIPNNGTFGLSESLNNQSKSPSLSLTPVNTGVTISISSVSSQSGLGSNVTQSGASVNSNISPLVTNSSVNISSSNLVPDFRQSIPQNISQPLQPVLSPSMASSNSTQTSLKQNPNHFIPVGDINTHKGSSMGSPHSQHNQSHNSHSQQLHNQSQQVLQPQHPGMSVAQSAVQPVAVPAAGYYVPQPAVYIDQNGQPMYYRVAPQPPQYQPELMYHDGSAGDPMQVSYIPVQNTGYWPGSAMSSDPNQLLQSSQLFVQGTGQPMDPNLMRRVMQYPPVAYAPSGSVMGGLPQGGPPSPTNPSGRAMMPTALPAGNMYGLQPSMAIMSPQTHMLPLQQRSINEGAVGGPMNGIVGLEGYHQIMPGGIRDDYNRGIGHPVSTHANDNRSYSGNHNSGGSTPYGSRPNSFDEERNREFFRNDRSAQSERTSERPSRNTDRSHDRNFNSNSGRRNTFQPSTPTPTDPTNLASPSRDSMVDEFRNTNGKSRQWNLRDLTGHVVAFCQDQHGSRFIQQRLEVCTDAEKQLVFEEIVSSANILMTDVFGNYVLQKLFEFGTPEHCESLSSLLQGQCVTLSLQMYGCRVVQKALEYVTNQRLILLVEEFENPQVLLNCVHDANGNHVIQKCIEVISKAAADNKDTELQELLSSRIQFIIETFQNRVKELSSHPYGCRVIQRILEHCSNNQKAPILEELRLCCADLVQDCYGNYVIQFVMQHGWEADRAVLIKEVHANLIDFSQHKFASNVVEKCLQYASKRDRDEMIWKIINLTFDPNNPIDGKGNSALETMVRDPYANYVVQKVIDVSDEKQRGAILRYVKENIQQLRRYTYGKHIIMRLEKITNEKF